MINLIKKIFGYPVEDKKIENSIKSIGDFLARYAVLVGVLMGALYFYTPVVEEFRTIRLIELFWGIAMFNSGLSVYIYTQINYSKELLSGADKQYSIMERSAMVRTLGDIFKANFALVGLCVFAVYLAQFAKG